MTRRSALVLFDDRHIVVPQPREQRADLGRVIEAWFVLRQAVRVGVWARARWSARRQVLGDEGKGAFPGDSGGFGAVHVRPCIAGEGMPGTCVHVMRRWHGNV